MTFCLEEGMGKLHSIKEFESKEDAGVVLTKEDHDNYKQSK